MEEISLDDIVKKKKVASKSPGKKGGQETAPSRGETMLETIDSFDESIREIHRPLTGKERAKIKVLMNESDNCMPDPEDVFVIQKLMDAFHLVVEMMQDLAPQFEDQIPLDEPIDTELDAHKMAFELGMAYERLKSKGSL
ncbi:MAG: hypothetical protein PHV74_14185 [Dehalococcoidia bacterium]|nr:hypothetical protein [Dehalococcoidia bacterium]